MLAGYQSENEEMMTQTGGRKPQKYKTVKQRLAAKARRDTRKIIRLTDTLPKEVYESGFHYNENSSREILEESHELGNQSDNESEFPTNRIISNPIIQNHSLEYRVVANKRPGGKPVIQIKGLALDYDNTQSPFVNVSYLDNGQVSSGVLNMANKQYKTITGKQQHRKKLMRKKTAKRGKSPK